MWVLISGMALAGSAYDALKLRDGGDCQALGTGPAVRDELIALAEGDAAPPYVPMRAADCLLEGFAGDPLVVSRASVWVAEPKWAGLALVVAAEVDRFSVDDSVAIARAAVAGPDEALRARMIRRFSKSERVEVRKVVEEVDGTGAVR